MEIFPEALVESHELADAKRGQQKRNGEASGVNGEEKDAASDMITGGSDGKNGGENRADARRPSKSEGEAEQKTAPNAGLLNVVIVKPNVAIEPSGERRTEKANKREREEMNGFKTDQMGHVAGKSDRPNQDEQDAKNNS